MKKILTNCTIPIATMFGIYLSFSSVTAHAGDVKKIYKDTCELCHGADGKGSEAGKQFQVPDFTNPEYQKSRTDADMKKSMTEGTKNPNYVKLSDLGVDAADLDPLVKLVREFGGK
ncbi:cytochrome c [Candidatus Brocadia pituitae]|nr:cytochrome c [Candidatus Brocadia pituitae]